MLEKKMTYVDFGGTERTESFFFHLTEADVAEMEMSLSGGMSNTIQRIVDEKNPAEIINMFKSIIKKAYGKKSPDGRRFEKSDEIWNDFAQTNAYSDLFMLLATDADEAAKFVNGIIPKTKPAIAPRNLK